MKITDVRVDRLKVRGSLLRVFTDEGIVGLSEVSAMPGMRGFVDEGLKPILMGKDPRRIGLLAAGADPDSSSVGDLRFVRRPYIRSDAGAVPTLHAPPKKPKPKTKTTSTPSSSSSTPSSSASSSSSVSSSSISSTPVQSTPVTSTPVTSSSGVGGGGGGSTSSSGGSSSSGGVSHGGGGG